MDWVGNRWETRRLLDQPVVPSTFRDGVNETVAAWVVCVLVEQVGHGGHAPVDVQAGLVECPDNDHITTWGDLSTCEVNVQGRSHLGEVAAWNRLGPVWIDVGGLSAVRDSCEGGADRVRSSNTGVRPDCAAVPVVGALASSVDLSTEPVVGSGLVSVDDNIVTLADTNGEPLSREGLRGNVVRADDLHRMVVERDLDVVVDGHIDQSKEVLLALGDGDVVVLSTTLCVLVGAVDQDVVSRWRAVLALKVDERVGGNLESSLVVPIRELVDTKIDVIVGRSRSVEEHRANNTVTVLVGEVRVVPRSTELSGLE